MRKIPVTWKHTPMLKKLKWGTAASSRPAGITQWALGQPEQHKAISINELKNLPLLGLKTGKKP